MLTVLTLGRTSKPGKQTQTPQDDIDFVGRMTSHDVIRHLRFHYLHGKSKGT